MAAGVPGGFVAELVLYRWVKSNEQMRLLFYPLHVEYNNQTFFLPFSFQLTGDG